MGHRVGKNPEPKGKRATGETRRWHVLVQDDSCHWYVIPADKVGEWEAWDKFEDGVVPAWAEAVGGAPLRVRFREWEMPL